MATNKEVALGLSRAIMTGEWRRVEEMIDESFIYIGDGRPPMNKQEYIGFMRGVLCAAMGDMKMDFARVVGEGDMVAVDYTNEMTHRGTFLGIPATGRRVMASGQFMREVKNGKVTREWQTTNAAGLMAQLRG